MHVDKTTFRFRQIARDFTMYSLFVVIVIVIVIVIVVVMFESVLRGRVSEL